ncbi:MAG: DUF2330 domain-containing protein [Alphaproteobacteria bacterium]|nr:DUF2330 domain-containing protein [Alphaproteobacteria bacterium]
MNSAKKRLIAALAAGTALITTGGAVAFCGFYVAKADTKLFNKASKVVLMRDGDRTVITMASDYEGPLEDFAMVVPVPTVLERDQIHVTENAIVDHLDAYTAPRLVEYFDEDPCRPVIMMERMAQATSMDAAAPMQQRAKSLGVTIEAEYTVGEYDIQILSADQSDGLSTYLTENGYQIPTGAEKTLASYIKQGTKFFIAKVNLEEQAKTGRTYLRPLQMAFETRKFMLPIRLGMANADGKQELFVFTLTRNGRVEAANYRTVKLPTGQDVPRYVKGEFGDFYKAMFEEQTRKENEQAVFLEYAWDMAWCDPCAADPLSSEELRELGVYWTDGSQESRVRPTAAPDVFVTRLHVSYDREHFPEDLIFKQTGDRSNFQGRYVIRHPYQGNAECKAGEDYRAGLPIRFDEEAQTLARLTGWSIDDIRNRMETDGQSTEPGPEEKSSWWKRLWGGEDKEG